MRISRSLRPQRFISTVHSPVQFDTTPAHRYSSPLTSLPSAVNGTPSCTNILTFSRWTAPWPFPLNWSFHPTAPTSGPTRFPLFAPPLRSVHSPKNPPTKKFDATTLWQGTNGANGLFRSAVPTERGEPEPKAMHMALYVLILPAGTFSMRSYTSQ